MYVAHPARFIELPLKGYFVYSFHYNMSAPVFGYMDENYTEIDNREPVSSIEYKSVPMHCIRFSISFVLEKISRSCFCEQHFCRCPFVYQVVIEIEFDPTEFYNQ